jgi:hypothetical protein
VHTPSPTMTIDELAYVLDVSVDDIRAKRHAWTRWHGFPRPLTINRNVYVRARVEQWLHDQANAQSFDSETGAPVPPLDPRAMTDDAAETHRGHVLDDLKAYARGGS